MVVDHMAQAQQPVPNHSQPQALPVLPISTNHDVPIGPLVNSAPNNPVLTVSYPGLSEYMGLELSEALIRENMPEYLPNSSQANSVVPSTGSVNRNGVNMVAPISGHSPGLVKAQVSHGVRQIVLCKDRENKVGLKTKAVNKGVFVCLVARGSPAALG